MRSRRSLRISMAIQISYPSCIFFTSQSTSSLWDHIMNNQAEIQDIWILVPLWTSQKGSLYPYRWSSRYVGRFNQILIRSTFHHSYPCRFKGVLSSIESRQRCTNPSTLRRRTCSWLSESCVDVSLHDCQWDSSCVRPSDPTIWFFFLFPIGGDLWWDWNYFWDPQRLSNWASPSLSPSSVGVRPCESLAPSTAWISCKVRT